MLLSKDMTTEVPLLDLKVQNQAIRSELLAAFENILDSGHYILGGAVDRFESEVAAFLGSKHAIGVSSGTDAILLALMTLGIGHGDEVICPTFTFFATGGCISRVGAKPVFIDSLEDSFNSDPSSIEAHITEKTKAIITVPLFGQSADMDTIMAIAHKHNLPVIEDAAQSLGASYKGKSVGTIGDFGTYSFFPSKNLGALGDAGLLVTQDDDLAQQARMLRVHGSKPKYFHKYVGGNFRIDAMQAALLSVKLKSYNDYTRARQSNATYYTEELLKIDGVQLNNEGNKENAAILIPTITSKDNTHIWNQFTLRVLNGKRDDLKTFLNERSIRAEIYYPLCMHKQECFQDVVDSSCKLPISEQLSEEVISIPIYPELTRAQQDAVIAAIRDFVSN